MKKRLILFLKYLGIGQLAFEENVGLSRGYVNKVGDNITLKSLDKIEAAYPELNINWLKTGSGEMLKQSSGRDSINISNTGAGNVANTGRMGNVNTNDERIKDLERELLEARAEIKSLKSTIEMLIQSIKR